MHHQTPYRSLYILIASAYIKYLRAGAMSQWFSQMTLQHLRWLHLTHVTKHTNAAEHTRTHTRVSVPPPAIIKSGGPQSRNPHEGAGGRVITWPTGHDPVTPVCVNRFVCTHVHTQTHTHNLSFIRPYLKTQKLQNLCPRSRNLWAIPFAYHWCKNTNWVENYTVRLVLCTGLKLYETFFFLKNLLKYI